MMKTLLTGIVVTVADWLFPTPIPNDQLAAAIVQSRIPPRAKGLLLVELEMIRPGLPFAQVHGLLGNCQLSAGTWWSWDESYFDCHLRVNFEVHSNPLEEPVVGSVEVFREEEEPGPFSPHSNYRFREPFMSEPALSRLIGMIGTCISRRRIPDRYGDAAARARHLDWSIWE